VESLSTAVLRQDQRMIEGFTAKKFEAVQTAFAANFADGHDVGASVAIVHQGEIVVDLWGGYTDATKTQEWQRDTLINVWSTTKTMTALCVLMLADQGSLDVDAPVAKYWPEFAANGKENVLVRHVMAHTAGLPGWDEPMTAETLYDWDKTCANLAAQAPWWTPGDGSGYHAISQGYLAGEIVRRVSGKTLGTFFAEQVAGPLGADFHIGTNQAQDHRVIPVIPPPSGAIDAALQGIGGIALRALGNPKMNAETSATIPWRRAEIPAAGGHGNARSVAIAQSAVSHGGTSIGRRLLTDGATDVIFREQCNGTDRVLLTPLRHGIGWGLPNEAVPLPNEKCCWWGGWGGSLVVNDLENGLTFAYVMNRMLEGTSGDNRAGSLLMSMYMSLMS
jgi:CubicO group peptidase (beta-lactamase class C family)